MSEYYSNTYSIDNTNTVKTIEFKIKTTFTNSVVHWSPTLKVVVICNTYYFIYDTSYYSTTTTQLVRHDGGASDGFTVPTYWSS
jgi:hypothetical protein